MQENQVSYQQYTALQPKKNFGPKVCVRYAFIQLIKIHLMLRTVYVCAYHLGVDVFLEAASQRTDEPFALIKEALADKDLALRVLGGTEHGVVLVLQHHTLPHHRQQRVAVAVTQGEGC
jgi:hypothetical protein